VRGPPSTASTHFCRVLSGHSPCAEAHANRVNPVEFAGFHSASTTGERASFTISSRYSGGENFVCCVLHGDVTLKALFGVFLIGLVFLGVGSRMIFFHYLKNREGNWAN
jgi:hypothetical protein